MPLQDDKSEQACRFEVNGFCMVFCKDGLCMVRIHTLDRAMQVVREKESVSQVIVNEKRRLSQQWLSSHRQTEEVRTPMYGLNSLKSSFRMDLRNISLAFNS